MSDAAYKTFVFESYEYNRSTGVATFTYSFDSTRRFTEVVTFDAIQNYDAALLDKALRLAFLTAGVSYYKCFPAREVVFTNIELSEGEAKLMNHVYHEGLSQFMFENQLTLESIVHFTAGNRHDEPIGFTDKGVLVLQSGGKDSLLLAEILQERQVDFTGVYMSSSGDHPGVLDDIGASRIRVVKREIDGRALAQARADGALNGHVPVTYITYAYSLVDAILHGENTVLASIGREGAEPHEWIGDMPVNHQWSKTWEAEQMLAEYVHAAISPDIHVGSPLRRFSELRVAELFVQKAWSRFGHRFSSCNVANYRQGHDNNHLSWCGECPKCANSFLLFAPFVKPDELMGLFSGKDLFASQQLTETFKGLLGIDGVMKPFECVGEVAELRKAYHMAQERYPGAYQLPFVVPESTFDYIAEGEYQDWTDQYATT